MRVISEPSVTSHDAKISKLFHIRMISVFYVHSGRNVSIETLSMLRTIICMEIRLLQSAQGKRHKTVNLFDHLQPDGGTRRFCTSVV